MARQRLKIQALITACVDTGVHQGLLQMHENEGSWGARGSLNSAMEKSTTPGCGASTRITGLC